MRILRREGWVAVIWNDRLSDATSFSNEYASLKNCAKTTPASDAPPLSAGLERLFAGTTPVHASFSHFQNFDLSGLLGRARSSGFLPPDGAPGCDKLLDNITELFHRHQENGQVQFQYVAQLYVGQLKA